MEIKPVIYISSTFFDLEEHRKILIGALQKTQSFEVRCMENYGTISKPPLQQCLKDVAEAEFYILLLGNRYGYIPEGERLSITNLEYKLAIGDTDRNVVANIPNTNKCVLPFLLDKNYQLSNAVCEAIKKEEEQEGDPLTQQKKEKLEQLKARIKADFTLDKLFTTAEDLVGKLFGALIPELVKRNYASLLNKIALKEEIVYRCDRETPRNQFLVKNYGKTNFIKVFVIHGESAELPDIFSDNISHYELKINQYFEINSLTKFISNIPEKFFAALALDLHVKIFDAVPEEEAFTLEDLVNKVFTASQTDNVVVRIQIGYKSWGENSQFIQALFQEISRISKPQSSKSFYLLFNIIYRTEAEQCDDVPQSALLLDKLQKIDITDIEGWVKTYFFFNTKTDLQSRSRASLLAKKICRKYFPDYVDTEDKKFCMEDAIEILRDVVNDFNNNEQLFANYTKLYS